MMICIEVSNKSIDKKVTWYQEGEEKKVITHEASLKTTNVYALAKVVPMSDRLFPSALMRYFLSVEVPVEGATMW